MSKTWRAKDPEDVADYGFDWSGLIAMGDGPDDDAIETSTADVVEGDVEVDDAPGHGHAPGSVEGAPVGQATVTWLKGGTAGTACVINLHIVTQGGREFDQSIKIKIKER